MNTRMRLLREAYEQLKLDDPDTNITIYALRTIVKSGKIATVNLGRKTLINYDSLIEYLNNGDNQKSNGNSSLGEIRRVG